VTPLTDKKGFLFPFSFYVFSRCFRDQNDEEIKEA
jgi:hypothetical protein